MELLQFRSSLPMRNQTQLPYKRPFISSQDSGAHRFNVPVLLRTRRYSGDAEWNRKFQITNLTSGPSLAEIVSSNAQLNGYEVEHLFKRRFSVFQRDKMF